MPHKNERPLYPWEIGLWPDDALLNPAVVSVKAWEVIVAATAPDNEEFLKMLQVMLEEFHWSPSIMAMALGVATETVKKWMNGDGASLIVRRYVTLFYRLIHKPTEIRNVLDLLVCGRGPELYRHTLKATRPRGGKRVLKKMASRRMFSDRAVNLKPTVVKHKPRFTLVLEDGHYVMKERTPERAAKLAKKRLYINPMRPEDCEWSLAKTAI